MPSSVNSAAHLRKRKLGKRDNPLEEFAAHERDNGAELPDSDWRSAAVCTPLETSKNLEATCNAFALSSPHTTRPTQL